MELLSAKEKPKERTCSPHWKGNLPVGRTISPIAMTMGKEEEEITSKKLFIKVLWSQLLHSGKNVKSPPPPF